MNGMPWTSPGPAGPRGLLHGVHRYDVVIIGAGLTGLSAAVELLEHSPDYNGADLARWIVNGHKDPQSFALPWVRPRAPWVPRGRLVDRLLDRYLTHLAGRES